MFDTIVLLLLLAAHIVLCALSGLRLYYSPVRMTMAHMLWIVCLPVFGPIAGLVFVSAANGAGPDLSWMETHVQEHRLRFGMRTQVDETVPLEEALLINDPQRRRALMMNILRTDPMSYLDLLLVARFNEDTETAHYAASTIMELQRQLQIEIQQRQAEVLHDAQDIDKRRDHIELLAKYCESGLLEGQLLRRQRLMLAEALDDALRLEETDDLLAHAVRNHLALEQPMGAKQAADRMLARWPLQENAWLEAMRVAVETRNQHYARMLIASMKSKPIDWSKQGREQIALWMEAAQ